MKSTIDAMKQKRDTLITNLRISDEGSIFGYAAHAADLLAADAEELALYQGTLESRDRNISDVVKENIRLQQQQVAPEDTVSNRRAILEDPGSAIALMQGFQRRIKHMEADAQQVEVPEALKLWSKTIELESNQFDSGYEAARAFVKLQLECLPQGKLK